MPEPVKLYIYDLSNGLARSLSLSLTGTQIDGIWHTSVVVYNREIFYGNGIDTTAPGKSHHGSPLRVVDVGETEVDEETLWEWVDEVRETYTGDKYHLLDFNCNSFTSDLVGFLTGGTIPSYIKDLPTDFLATPFGASLRPTIDAMYRRPPAGSTQPQPDPPALLQSIAAQAQAQPPTHPSAQELNTLTSPIHIASNSASFHSILASNRAVVAFFTSRGCAPCRVIEPVFEELAQGKENATFVKVDLEVMMSQDVARELGVSVTPTFVFFLDGKKIAEIKGADQNELRTQVDLLIFSANPPHPHTQLPIKQIPSLSRSPILSTASPILSTAFQPALDRVLARLTTSIDASFSPPDATNLKSPLTTSFLPCLKDPKRARVEVEAWVRVTRKILGTLSREDAFPLIDLWRLALLNPAISMAVYAKHTDVLVLFLTTALDSPRAYLLVSLRLLSNVFADKNLGAWLVGKKRDEVTTLLVQGLLHDDVGVRTAGASLAFNVVVAGEGQEGDWNVEMVSAVVEALDRESVEDVVHRLTATLALLLYRSPCYETELKPLLEVLQARSTLLGKLECVKKAEVRKLVEEVAMELCP